MLAFFAPVKWAGVLRDSRHCLLYPEITLQMVDRLYFEGLAKAVVYNNLVGIFKMADPREPVNEAVVDMSADIFVSKYGSNLSIFGALHYFASYLTEYKSTYGKFDLQDVLRQCGKAYFPWWSSRLSRAEQAQAETEKKDGLRGTAAMWQYLRREYVAKGQSVRDSNLYHVGYVPDKDVATIEQTTDMPPKNQQP